MTSSPPPNAVLMEAFVVPTSLLLVLILQPPPDSVRRTRPDTLETIVVRTTRAGVATSTSQSTLDRAAIQSRPAGQDVPLSLGGLTSVTTTSDAGGYSGYSALRIRGIDQTRLTISLDGIPLNDPEDQVLYFSNVPDLLSSIQSVRVQRGVGASGFGTASFGGSLNFESISVAATPRFGQAQLSAGSFGTQRVGVSGATGLSGRWAGYGRVTVQSTNGYRDHSGNRSRSGFTSAAWFGARDAVKFIGFAGRSKTQLAYYAASEEALAVNPRANPMLPEERDDFHQELAGVQYSHALGRQSLLTVTGYRNSAAGNYDVAVGDELWNFNLEHVWYGVLSAMTFRSDRFSVSGGAHISDYRREHSLFIRPNLTSRVYDNTGFKQDQSGFLKTSWISGDFAMAADVELRRTAFQYQPTAGSPIGRPDVSWVFFNPKVGLTWHAGPGLVAVGSLGRTSREPTRSDLFAGADDLDQSLAAEILPLTKVSPETVTDLEIGVHWHHPNTSLGINGFAMRFRNEIAPIGALAITGTPLRRNVARSSRVGIEVDGSWHAAPAIDLAANVALMRARIAEYRDEASGAVYRDVPPLLSPGIVANMTAQWRPGPRTELSMSLRHIGPSHLANDGNAALRLPAATIVSGAGSFGWSRFRIRGEAINLLAARAFGSGYTDGATRFLFPLAGRMFLATLEIGL